MYGDEITPGAVGRVFWRWFWVGAGALALIGGLVYAGHAFGWWLSAQDATHQAENTQNGYSNQTTLRQQVTSQLATVYSLTTQIAEAKGDQSLVSALVPQREQVAATVCSDAGQITGTPLPVQQAQWVAANCSAGTVSPNSPLYQAGQL
jgi:hypothetical protein